MDTAELLKTQVESIEHGRELLREIHRQRQTLLADMGRTSNNRKWQEIADKRYDLLKAKREIQTKMGKMVKHA